ncbi:unnamed protein product [Malus baccata var. baccata]
MSCKGLGSNFMLISEYFVDDAYALLIEDLLNSPAAQSENSTHSRNYRDDILTAQATTTSLEVLTKLGDVRLKVLDVGITRFEGGRFWLKFPDVILKDLEVIPIPKTSAFKDLTRLLMREALERILTPFLSYILLQMSQLITRRQSVTNAPLTLSTSTAPPVSAPLIQEPTPLTKATSTVSQVPVSLTSSVLVQPLSARWPHWHRRELEPFDHTSSASKVEGEASQPVRDLIRAIQTAGLQVSLPASYLDPPSTSEPPHPPDTQ